MSGVATLLAVPARCYHPRICVLSRTITTHRQLGRANPFVATTELRWWQHGLSPHSQNSEGDACTLLAFARLLRCVFGVPSNIQRTSSIIGSAPVRKTVGCRFDSDLVLQNVVTLTPERVSVNYGDDLYDCSVDRAY